MNIVLRLLKLTTALLVIVLALLVAGYLFLRTSLLDADPELTTFEKASLADIQRIKQLAIEVNRQGESGIQQLELSDRDVNLAIAQFGPAMLKLPKDSFARVDFDGDVARVSATVPMRIIYSNVEPQIAEQLHGGSAFFYSLFKDSTIDEWVNLAWQIRVDENAAKGQWLTPGQLTVGQITLSQSLSERLADELFTIAMAQPRSETLRASWKNIQHMRMRDDLLAVDYILPEIGSALNSAQALILTPGEQQLVSIYSNQIRLLPQRGALVELLSKVFQLASERSNTSADPVAENRAALLALAKVFGGDQLDALLDGNVNANQFRQRSPFTVYGRSDLAQHMMLSSGLTLLTDGRIADLVGLEKEIADLMGGRSISAWDLLADKTGVRLAENATRSARSARNLQTALAAASRDQHIMPDLRQDFAYAEQQFGPEDIDELTVLVELYLDQLPIYQK